MRKIKEFKQIIKADDFVLVRKYIRNARVYNKVCKKKLMHFIFLMKCDIIEGKESKGNG